MKDTLRTNDITVRIRQSTVTLSDVRLDDCPDVIDASSSSCMTSSLTDVSRGFELFALDNGLRPFTGRAVRIELFTARVLYRVSYRVLEYSMVTGRSY